MLSPITIGVGLRDPASWPPPVAGERSRRLNPQSFGKVLEKSKERPTQNAFALALASLGFISVVRLGLFSKVMLG